MVSQTFRTTTGQEPQDSEMNVSRCKKEGRTKERVRIASLNVGTLTGKSLEVCEMLRRRKVQIGCLQEVRWKKEGVKKLEGYKLFWHGNEEGIGGVAIMVTMEWEDRIVKVERICDRIIMVKLLFGHKMINFVSAYAPQPGRTEQEKEVFWDRLLVSVSQIPDSEGVVIGGDLNGRVGKGRGGYDEVHGGFGYGVRNEEGNSVLEFCVALNLVIGNTWFTRKEEKLVTYVSGGIVSVSD
jgi:hypothetical protein